MGDSQEAGPLRILIGSVGRRVYLVEWFETALRALRLEGEVHVTDADVLGAAYSRASHRHLLPRYEDPLFNAAMEELFDDLRPSLFFSVNDLELMHLATTGLADRLREFGGHVLALPAEIQARAHDKYGMSSALQSAGVPTPETALLSDRDGVSSIARTCSHLIIKDRFGSGSSGLTMISSDDVELALKWYARHRAETGRGSTYVDVLDSYVLQPAIEGREFGVDVVAPLIEGAHELGVLARRKLRMRSGETDQAISVDARPFRALAADVAGWTGHNGLVDVDVIVANDGRPFVIDINPRFGGGYPFSHLAGADVPALYVSQLRPGMTLSADERLAYEVGVVSSKYEAAVRAGG